MSGIPSKGAREMLWKTACGHCKPVYRSNPEIIWSDDQNLLKQNFTHMSKKGYMKYHQNCIWLFQVWEFLGEEF